MIYAFLNGTSQRKWYAQLCASFHQKRRKIDCYRNYIFEVSLSLKQKKSNHCRLLYLVAGTGFFPALRFGKVQNGNTPEKIKSVKYFRVLFDLS
jgi:hypothetical protein